MGTRKVDDRTKHRARCRDRGDTIVMRLLKEGIQTQIWLRPHLRAVSYHLGQAVYGQAVHRRNRARED